MPTIHQATLGKLGEDAACRELRRRGYVILARGYRTRHGELDIVAREGDVLVFVEVKTRSREAFGGPLDAVTARKRMKLGRMALEYLSRSRLSKIACRFDVVGVAGRGRRCESKWLRMRCDGRLGTALTERRMGGPCLMGLSAHGTLPGLERDGRE